MNCPTTYTVKPNTTFASAQTGYIGEVAKVIPITGYSWQEGGNMEPLNATCSKHMTDANQPGS